ncbi:MAG: methyl-accepting chemotaxis protein, partial [Lachnospiraceae bacterium]|nr:methyl-accepting chemotaxis protein [Lachnospiraceae bacterium]
DITQMGGVIEKIVHSVANLDGTSGEMKEAGDSSTAIIKDLSISNDKTMEAIERIGEQVNATNESANRISEAIQLITSIAEETNLLSLNASIEAARAGEQGRGFAVVANQIQKLAEQSNESAQKVSEIIENLLKDSEKTVDVMEDVRKIVDEQQEKLDQTRKEFANVRNGIDESREETSEIKEQTDDCDSARVRVVDVISNLSAISQENAAATQQTTASMQELNATINLLAESAGNLTELSDRLEQEIAFFKL